MHRLERNATVICTELDRKRWPNCVPKTNHKDIKKNANYSGKLSGNRHFSISQVILHPRGAATNFDRGLRLCSGQGWSATVIHLRQSQACITKRKKVFCAAIDLLRNMQVITFGDTVFTNTDYADDVVLFANESADPACTCAGIHGRGILKIWTACALGKVQNLEVGPDADNLTINGRTVEGVSGLHTSVTKYPATQTPHPNAFRCMALAAAVMHDSDDVWWQQNLTALI